MCVGGWVWVWVWSCGCKRKLLNLGLSSYYKRQSPISLVALCKDIPHICTGDLRCTRDLRCTCNLEFTLSCTPSDPPYA